MLFQYAPYYTSSGYGRGVWQYLVDWGLLDAILPFLLIFVLVFAILQRIALFHDENGRGDRKINGILGLIIGAMVVIPHVTGLYPPEMDPINIINQFLPHTAVLLIAVLCVILLLGLAGGQIPNLALWAIALVATGFLIFMIMMAIVPGFLPWFDFLRDPAIQAIIISLLSMGLIGYFVIREPTGTGDEFAGLIRRWMGPPPP